MMLNRLKAAGPLRHLLRVCATAACLAVGTTAVAASYWTEYSGTIHNSNIPGVIDGQRYTVHLIFNNGGTSTNNQTWGKAHLKCVIWRMNDDGGVHFVQDLTAPGANWNADGQIQTNGAGTMTSMLDQVGTFNLPGTSGAGAGTVSNLSPAPVEPYWGVPKTAAGNAVFISGAVADEYTDIFEDAADTAGIPTSPSDWTPVTPFEGLGFGPELPGCAGPEDPLPPVNNVTAVPTLDFPALALMGMAAAGLGARRLRQRRKAS